ncbi:MAG: hypothetical protein V4444_10885 [Pseudomonadota bacterium]
MSDLRTFLEGREKHLETEVAKLRALIAPLERELFEVRVAQRAVGKKSPEPQQRHLFSQSNLDLSEAAAEVWKQYLENKEARSASPYARLTIKELVLKALDEQFPSGATANQLLELFAGAWDRGEIARTSLSPQLSRLKDDHKIDHNGQLWFLRSARSDQQNAAADQ